MDDICKKTGIWNWNEYCEGPGMELGRVKVNAPFLHPRALNELKIAHWALNATLKIIKDHWESLRTKIKVKHLKIYIYRGSVG